MPWGLASAHVLVSANSFVRTGLRVVLDAGGRDYTNGGEEGRLDCMNKDHRLLQLSNMKLTESVIFKTYS